MRALIVLALLLAPLAGQAAGLALAGKSFQDHAAASHAEEPTYSIPENFPGLAAPPPRREPATGSMLLASFGLMLYLGSRRKRALAALG